MDPQKVKYAGMELVMRNAILRPQMFEYQDGSGNHHLKKGIYECSRLRSGEHESIRYFAIGSRAQNTPINHVIPGPQENRILVDGQPYTWETYTGWGFQNKDNKPLYEHHAEMLKMLARNQLVIRGRNCFVALPSSSNYNNYGYYAVHFRCDLIRYWVDKRRMRHIVRWFHDLYRRLAILRKLEENINY